MDNISRDLLINRDGAAFRQAGIAARDRAEPRPPGLPRHSGRARGRGRRRDAAAARRRMGHAAEDSAHIARLRSRCRRRTAKRPASSCGKLGYGPDSRLAVKLSTRNIPAYRDAAVVADRHLREIYIDAELDLIETAQLFPKLTRKDYQLAVDVAERRSRRPGSDILRELCLRCRAQLYRLLRPGDSTG